MKTGSRITSVQIMLLLVVFFLCNAGGLQVESRSMPAKFTHQLKLGSSSTQKLQNFSGSLSSCSPPPISYSSSPYNYYSPPPSSPTYDHSPNSPLYSSPSSPTYYTPSPYYVSPVPHESPSSPTIIYSPPSPVYSSPNSPTYHSPEYTSPASPTYSNSPASPGCDSNASPSPIFHASPAAPYDNSPWSAPYIWWLLTASVMQILYDNPSLLICSCKKNFAVLEFH